MNYLITGATGNIGSLVVNRLLDRGERPRVLARDAQKALLRYGDRVDIFVGDFSDATSMAAALSGVDAFLLVSSVDDLAARDEVAAKAAKAAGVKHLVKISSMSIPQKNIMTGMWHAQGEAVVRATGVPFTFVRSAGFMENCLQWARSIKSEGVVRSSAGDGKTPVIHSEDILSMEIQMDMTFAKPESDDLIVLATGLDEAKTLVDQLSQRSVSALFTVSAENRFAVADKLFAMGPAVIPELESRIENDEEPESTTYAAMILFKRGSIKGVPRLIQSLKDRVGPIGAIASALASARIPGASEAIVEILTRETVRKDPYTAVTLLEALRDLGTPLPNEALQQLEESAPHLRRFF